MRVLEAFGTSGLASPFARLCSIRQSEAGQRQANQAGTEFLKRLPPRGGLGQTLGQFIKFVVHSFPFVRFVDTQEVSGECTA
jgi:hypothetical protein